MPINLVYEKDVRMKRRSIDDKFLSKKNKTSRNELKLYFKSYKNGTNDFHWKIFREVKKICNPEHVLYPGCHRHITASLVFPDVVYVDNYKKVESLFSDPQVLEWVGEHKEYKSETKIKFICKNFQKNFGELEDFFDVIISASAGIVSTYCTKYLKINGYFLISDAHFDARMLSLDSDFQLTHVWDESSETFLNSPEDLQGHFTTMVNGEKITKAMVDESINKPKARRSFKLKKEAMFYLFKKIN